MRAVRVVVIGPGASTSLAVLRAEGFFARLRGLLGRETLVHRCGLWISPCNAVHTVGMRVPIDLVFVDAHGRVLEIEARLAPYRVRFCRGASGALELAPGAASRLGLDRQGARLAWPGTSSPSSCGAPP